MTETFSYTAALKELVECMDRGWPYPSPESAAKAASIRAEAQSLLDERGGLEYVSAILNSEQSRAAHRESTETAADAVSSGGGDCSCPVATLETAFRPHEALVGALDTLAELGVVTLESDIDVVAARLIAALDDVGACVAYEEDTEPDERPRNAEDVPEPAPADEVCPFLIPFIKSEPWWTAREVFDVGGMQFAVVTGQSGHTPGLTDVRGGK